MIKNTAFAAMILTRNFQLASDLLRDLNPDATPAEHARAMHDAIAAAHDDDIPL